MRPRVTAVIVSFRSRDALPACLDSLARCAESLALEVIVVDNDSGDGTVEWLEQAHPGVEVIANPENRGFTRGVNQGLARARGDHLLVLNPDCEIGAGALERLIRILEEGPGLAAAAPMLVDGEGMVARSCGRFPDLWTLLCDHLGMAQARPESRWFGSYKYGGTAMASLGRVDWASGAALLMPRPAFERVGGLDESIFMYMEEVDWCRRAARLGLGVRYVPDARFVHHGQRSSRQVPGQTYLHNLRSRVYYFRKHHGAIAAWCAKLILLLSLSLKWCASMAGRTRRASAGIYAAGLEAVWAA
jgi:N-acetylglucosaminyl-diphospho-decaprenol L-rhamnosyltransferase